MDLTSFASYLADRHKKVKYNETSSEFQTIKCWVPQGSILGPLLFIIFINDLPRHLIHCRSDLYADDTTISAVGKNLGDIEKVLNIDAENTYQWCTENGLTINVAKTKRMLIAMPQKLWRINTCLQVYINNVQVPVSTCEKLLGVHIQTNLDWRSHVNNACEVVKRTLKLLRSIKSYLPVHARKMLCSSYMLSHMDYLNNVWGNTTQEN